MPTTGAVTVTNGGTLVPAGLTWTTTAAPTFHVLGDLNLNAGSTVDFAFDPTNQDNIVVGGSLTLPTSGSVTVNINDLGGLYNNIPIFTFGSLTNTFNPSSLVVVGGTASIPPGARLFLY